MKNLIGFGRENEQIEKDPIEESLEYHQENIGSYVEGRDLRGDDFAGKLVHVGYDEIILKPFQGDHGMGDKIKLKFIDKPQPIPRRGIRINPTTRKNLVKIAELINNAQGEKQDG